MMPFDEYPGKGRMLLGKFTGANCRHEYGLKFMRATGQTKCAFCELDLTSSYESWLTMVLDHVVPRSVCNELGVPGECRDDGANAVLACSACNTFRNKYRVPSGTLCPQSPEAFFALRDVVFEERRQQILARHAAERKFFESRPWASR